MNKRKKKISLSIYDKLMIIIAAILFIIALVIKKASVFRPILTIMAILIVSFFVYKITSKKKQVILPVFILGILLTVIIDSIVAVLFSKIPIYSYNIINIDNSRVYSGIGITVWQCDKSDYDTIIVDPFYEKEYKCDYDSLEAIDSNSFLNSVVENYDSYKDTYVKITGKISKKSSQNYIEMQPYEKSDITANGYVSFSSSITLKIVFKESDSELDLYDVYDEITVVGLVKNLDTNDDGYIIYMDNSEIVSDVSKEITSISTIASESCKDSLRLVYEEEEYKVETYCVDEVYVNFNDTQYELAVAISSGKMELSDLLDGLSITEDDKGEIYRADEYSVLSCSDSNLFVIGTSSEEFKKVDCEVDDD